MKWMQKKQAALKYESVQKQPANAHFTTFMWWEKYFQ
jgi:hypothetical protein